MGSLLRLGPACSRSWALGWKGGHVPGGGGQNSGECGLGALWGRQIQYSCQCELDGATIPYPEREAAGQAGGGQHAELSGMSSPLWY